MTEKRFIASSGGVYDRYKDERLLWSEWEEITVKLNNLNEKARERSKALSKLQKENEQLKSEIKDLNDVLARYEEKEKLSAQPNCHKCIEYSTDNVGDYCMSEDGLLGSAWEMFPLGWDYGNAKDCKEYDEVR